MKFFQIKATEEQRTEAKKILRQIKNISHYNYIDIILLALGNLLSELKKDGGKK